jgi:hypothetical protein
MWDGATGGWAGVGVHGRGPFPVGGSRWGGGAIPHLGGMPFLLVASLQGLQLALAAHNIPGMLALASAFATFAPAHC